MRAVYAETDTEADSYDVQIEALEEQILHVNALKMAQERDSDAWHAYQAEINTFTARARAMKAVKGVLQEYDWKIAVARDDAARAKARGDHAMDVAWLAVKWFGALGLVGVLVCMMWTPTVWFPIVTGLFLLLAAGAAVLALRYRPALFAESDAASATAGHLEVDKQRLLAQAEAGVFPAAERVPEPRTPPATLRLLGPDGD